MRSKTLYEKRLAIYLMFTGLSQKEVAEFFKLSHNSVNEWCQTSDFKMVRAEMLEFVRFQFQLDVNSKVPV